jgi:hypothetical protein
MLILDFHTHLWNVEGIVWRNHTVCKSLSKMWRSCYFSILACGEKSLGALRKNGLIHINFPY